MARYRRKYPEILWSADPAHHVTGAVSRHDAGGMSAHSKDFRIVTYRLGPITYAALLPRGRGTVAIGMRWFANVKRWFANDEGWFANVKRWFANYGLMFIYLFVTIVLFIVGWVLQHIAFTPPPPASPVYAAVFVDDPAAHVDLTANVDSDQPWNDSLTVAVKDASGKQAGWLLVIECPPGAPTSPPPVPLYSEAALQTSSSATPVTVYSRVRTHKLGCFPKSPPGTSGYNASSIDNVALPALQTDQAIQNIQAAPELYAQQQGPGAPIARLDQVFPGAACPSPTSTSPTPAPPTSTSPTPAPPTSTAVQATASPGAISASPAASQSPQLSSPPTGATTSPPGLGSPGCYSQAPEGTTFRQYGLPASVHTTETLTNVNLNGFHLDSMFPVGTVEADRKTKPGQATDDLIEWQGSSSLSPSLGVTNTAAQQSASEDTFIAGIMFGVVGGTFVAFLEKLPIVFRSRKGRKSSEGSSDQDSAGQENPPDSSAKSSS